RAPDECERAPDECEPQNREAHAPPHPSMLA
ncbi:MAG: hypothetical protein JWN44_2035, partial [Myxococcales bacterium]|nr:hypothetical protein [Myxococcales bacterium]